MTTLAEILLAPARRDRLMRQTAEWIERYVHEKPGLRGMALRAGLSAAKSARADAVDRAVARLLPECADALEPLYQRFLAGAGGDFGAYLREHADEAASAIMGVTDQRVAASSHRALAAGYRRLRGTLEHEVRALLPDIATMIARGIS